jgi:hypothetical protein
MIRLLASSVLATHPAAQAAQKAATHRTDVKRAVVHNHPQYGDRRGTREAPRHRSERRRSVRRRQGSLYIRGHGKVQYVLRLFAETGKVRMLRSTVASLRRAAIVFHGAVAFDCPLTPSARLDGYAVPSANATENRHGREDVTPPTF